MVYDLVHSKFRPFLKLIRLLSQITMLAQLKLQTIARISTGHRLVATFGQKLNVSHDRIYNKTTEVSIFRL